MKILKFLFLAILLLSPAARAERIQRAPLKISCVEKNGNIIVNFHAFSLPDKVIVKGPAGEVYNLNKNNYTKFNKKRNNYIIIKTHNLYNKSIFKNSGLYKFTFSDPVRVAYEQPNILRCDVVVDSWLR